MWSRVSAEVNVLPANAKVELRCAWMRAPQCRRDSRKWHAVHFNDRSFHRYAPSCQCLRTRVTLRRRRIASIMESKSWVSASAAAPEDVA